MIKHLHFEGKNLKWKKAIVDGSFRSGQYRKLGDGDRGWQPEAYELLKAVRLALAACGCGMGKTTLSVALAIFDIVNSGWLQKQLFVVPQRHIGDGFTKCDGFNHIKIQVEGVDYFWQLGDNNFCDSEDKLVMAKLKKWLLADSSSLRPRNRLTVTGIVAVCSHAAIGRLWKTLTKRERKQAIKNLTLRVDEAHHISGVFDELDDSMTKSQKIAMGLEATNLGNICRAICGNGPTSKLHLTTATFYRGDGATILSPSVADKFTTYYADWIKHFATLGIERFTVDFQPYPHSKSPVASVVEQIRAEPAQKHLVVVPPTGQKWRTRAALRNLFEEIYKVIPRERVLDLVTKSTQKANKELLLAEPKVASQESKFDVVVTCMLGREGTDWCPCSRIHNTACENSPTLAVQTAGRAFRKFVERIGGKIVGKTDVRILYYIQEFKAKPGSTEFEALRDMIADRSNHLAVSMQWDDQCHPIMIPVLPSERGAHRGEKSVPLSEIIGDQYHTIKREFMEELEYLDKVNESSVKILIDDVVESHGIQIPNEMMPRVRQAMLMLTLRILHPKLRVRGVDVGFVRKNGFDNLVAKNGRGGFFADYTLKDCVRLRQLLKATNWMVAAEAYKKAVKKSLIP